MIKRYCRAAAAIGVTARAGRAARSRSFSHFGRVSTRGDLRLQRGNICVHGSRRRGGRLAHVEHIIIEGNFRIAAKIKRAAIFELHPHNGVRIRLNGFFGEHFVADVRLTRYAIYADNFNVTDNNFDGAD